MLNTDLKVYKAKAANGRMDGASPVTSGVLQNVFPHVTSAQRTAGYFDYVKTFWKVADDSDGVLLDPEIYLDAPTKSLTDYVMLFVMGQRDKVSDITGYETGTDTERKYGTAYLAEDITAGDQTIVVTVKNAALSDGDDQIFFDGDTIKLTDKATADALTGNEELLTINGDPVVSSDGLKVTITVDELIANSYTAATTPTQASPRVSSVYQPSDIETSYTTPAISPSGSTGTLDDSTYPIILDNIGTVDEDWTLTFTDATHFTLSGDSLGAAVATGVISSDFAPNNSTFTKPYFTIETEAWGGTWTAGDTVTFTTHPAAVGMGQKRVVPAASASLANNKVTQVLVGEAV